MITVQNTPNEAFELTGLTATHESIQVTTTRFDMEWHVWEHQDNLTLLVFYRSDLFDRSTIERMTQSFEFLLEQALSDIESEVQPIVGAVIAFEEQLYRTWLDHRRVQNVTGLRKLKHRIDRGGVGPPHACLR